MTERQPNPTVVIDGHRIEYQIIGEGTAPPRLVFLHEGLGSIDLWRDYPRAVADATGERALVYSRYGHGWSDILTESRSPEFMHHEARVVLPELLEALSIESPLLIGHSDGGSISLIHAGSGHPVEGLVVLAPHVFVEVEYLPTVATHAEQFRTGDLAARMAKYHRDPAATFFGWGDLWLSEAFRDWNLEDVLPAIDVPVLGIQGLDDLYGSVKQLDAIERGLRGKYDQMLIPDCGHSPHLDHPEAVASRTVDFVNSLLG